MLKKFLFKRILPKIHKLYLSVNLKIKEIEIPSESKCLCLAPHADDESIGCGGLLVKYPDNFDVICLTDGRKGVKEKSAEEAIKIRKEEFSSAMKKACIKSFEFFDITDKQLIEGYEKFKTIDISKYDYIFIPNLLDQHPDHKAVSILLRQLLKESKPKDNLQIAFYEVWSTLALPNVFLDISDVIEKKRELINSHKSQVELKNYTDKAIALNCYRGLLRDRDYAEAFCVVDVNTFFQMCKECV